MKKRTKWIISISIAVVLMVAAFVAYRHSMVQNVFDEIYYSEVKNQKYLVTSTQFEHVKQLEIPIRNWMDDFNEYDTPYFYKEECLDTNEYLSITIYHNKPMIQITLGIFNNKKEDGNGECIVLILKYSVPERKLSYSELFVSTEQTRSATKRDAFTDPEIVMDYLQKHSITREDITRMQQELLDRIITDWCAGNAGLTRFSLENPGKFTIEDNTWARFEG